MCGEGGYICARRMIEQWWLINQADLPAFLSRELVEDILRGVVFGFDGEFVEAPRNGGVVLHFTQNVFPPDGGIPSIERVFLGCDFFLTAVGPSGGGGGVPRPRPAGGP